MTPRHPFPLRPLLSAIRLLPVLGVLAGCEPANPPAERAESTEDSYFKVPPQTVEAVHRNNLRHEPTDFLRSRSEDPIHWQGWTREIFAQAEKEQRLVFAVIGSGEFPSTVELLETLRKRSDLVEAFNSSYVNTLVDVNAHPELALQLTTLCAEIGRPISFPVLAWFSHEGNPVAWLPLTTRDVESLEEVFGSSESMVKRIWRDSPRYVIVNSARDSEARNERLALEARDPVDDETLRTSLRAATRSVAALYDPASGEVDGGGGLVPSGLLQFATQAAMSPEIPATTAQTLGTMTTTLSRTLLSSAIHDPLDGGFFVGRRSRGWEIPNALKTADTQSLMADALARASIHFDEPRFLEGARECLDYTGRILADGSSTTGDYTVVTDPDVVDRAFFWSQEKVRELLPEEEYEVARRAFNLSGLGNIPLESDPRRDYFRKNSLAQSRTIEAIAADTGRPVGELEELLGSATMRLRTHRQELLSRSNEVFAERSRITSVNANYAAALAQLSRSTGDQAHHQEAVEVLAALRDGHRGEDGRLLRFATSEGRRTIGARGEDYAALIEAHFSLYRNDLDPAHLTEILALAEETMARLRDEDGYLREAPESDRVLQSPIYSRKMVFGPSTWGRLYGPFERLNQLADLPTVAATAATIRSQLVADTDEQAMIHTDFLISCLVPLTDTVVILAGSPGSAEFDPLHRVLLRPEHEAVTVLHAAEGLPGEILLPTEVAPGATVRRGGEVVGTATSPAELEGLLTGETN